MNFFTSKNIICNGQYGFQKGKTTLIIAHYVILRLVEGLDFGEHTPSLFMDLSKAFDMLDHELLLAKLYVMGIRGVAIN